MFLGHTNPKLCVKANAIVVNLCKITEPKKRQLKVEMPGFGMLHHICHTETFVAILFYP